MMPASANNQRAAEETAEPEEEVTINILDEPAQPDFDISFLGEGVEKPSVVDLEMSYADKLDDVAVKVNRIFGKHDTCPLPPPEVRARFLDA